MRMEHWWFTARLRLKSLLLRNRVEREMDQELRFHLENKIEEGIANGLSPKEARHAAMRAMGGLEQKKEQMRDARRIQAFVVLTLALGIGVTSGVFSMVDALIFRPYPVPHASGVVSLVSTTQDSSYEDFSYREYLDIRDKTKARWRDCQRSHGGCGFQHRACNSTAGQGRDDGFRELLPGTRRGAANGARFSGR
jgi:macrolide transport system ATP-binding/permease protein